jgi:hypothetical protein
VKTVTLSVHTPTKKLNMSVVYVVKEPVNILFVPTHHKHSRLSTSFVRKVLRLSL